MHDNAKRCASSNTGTYTYCIHRAAQTQRHEVEFRKSDTVNIRTGNLWSSPLLHRLPCLPFLNEGVRCSDKIKQVFSLVVLHICNDQIAVTVYGEEYGRAKSWYSYITQFTLEFRLHLRPAKSERLSV